MPRCIKLLIAYDGTEYAGWQVQPGVPTIQGLIEEAICATIGTSVRILGSGRTDAGVHALGQVASFVTESPLAPEVLQRALNSRLPQDIVILDAAEAPLSFHPIRDCVRKRYRYLLHDGPVRDVFRRNYCWQVRRHLDAEAMHEAAQQLLGTHDFSAFETTGSPRATSIRTVYDLFVRRGIDVDQDLITLEVEADGFLYNMVRAIVGTLVEVGRGARDRDWVAEVLKEANRDKAGATAPPQGLFMLRVDYD